MPNSTSAYGCVSTILRTDPIWDPDRVATVSVGVTGCGLRCDLRCADTGSRLRRIRRRSVSIGDTDMTEQEAAEGDKVLVHYTRRLDDGQVMAHPATASPCRSPSEAAR